jgi:two-component system alkaline phosphatase synthesis response regulator PhoP
MKAVCLVEDEKSLVELIKLNLEMEGMKVTVFQDGIEAKLNFEHQITYDLIILDVMLPNFSGFDLCHMIRKKSDVPILFLSAKGTAQDKIKGLKLGANDYLAKPFDLEELLLRVHVLTHGVESEKSHKKRFSISNKQVDFETFEVLNSEKTIIHTFSKKEAALLDFFIQNENKVISRDQILDHVWGKDQFPTSRTIDNFVLTYRKLFENNPKAPKHFQSIRGIGYKFNSQIE